MTVKSRGESGWAGGVVVALSLVVLLSGCATQRATQTERLLSASGFHMKLAETPAQTQQLSGYTQRRLMAEQKDGKTYFVYVDARSNCIYVGDEAAYQSYQSLVETERLADEERVTAQMNEATAAMNWEVWGPWNAWGW